MKQKKLNNLKSFVVNAFPNLRAEIMEKDDIVNETIFFNLIHFIFIFILSYFIYTLEFNVGIGGGAYGGTATRFWSRCACVGDVTEG